MVRTRTGRPIARVWAWAVCLGLLSSPSARAGGETTVVVTATGADGRAALAAAFREAIGRVVGTLVESEFVVRNDAVVRDEQREHAAGFIRTYRVLATDARPDGRVRVTVRATVARTSAPVRLRATRGVTAITVDDLRVEAETRAEARRTAAVMVAGLFADLPKLARAEVRGRPVPTRDGSGIDVAVCVSVDESAHGTWVRRAVGILDRVSVARDAVVVQADRVGPDAWRLREPFRGVFGASLPTGDSPGVTVALMTDRDRGWGLTRWRFYGVDADAVTSLAPLAGTPTLRLVARDRRGETLAEESIPLGQDCRGWVLFGLTDPTRVLVAPVLSDLSTGPGRGEGASWAAALTVRLTLRLTAAERDRLADLTAAVRWDGPPTGGPSTTP